jgi:hypothetical protein
MGREREVGAGREREVGMRGWGRKEEVVEWGMDWVLT